MNRISHCAGIRKAQAVYDFTKRSEVKLSPSPGRKFLVSDSELRNLTPNPSLSAVRKHLCFRYEEREQCESHFTLRWDSKGAGGLRFYETK